MSPYLADSFNREPKNLSDDFPYIEEDPAVLPNSLDPFTITTSTGFMPHHTPQVELPAKFKPLSDLVSEMPVRKLDGSPGLLATYQLGPVIDKGDALPDLIDEIDNLVASDGKPDLVAVTAIFRDYCFLSSAYLLEPCWERYNDPNLEGLGLGRPKLPKEIAGPLVKTAKMYVVPST